MTLRGKRVVREGQAGGGGLRGPGGNGLLGVRRRRAGKWWVASLAVTRMPPPMSMMTVGDDGANEVETHSSSDNISGAATPALATKTMQSLRGGVLKWCVSRHRLRWKEWVLLRLTGAYHLALAAREQYTAAGSASTPVATTLLCCDAG